jgi:hypothetical protein
MRIFSAITASKYSRAEAAGIRKVDFCQQFGERVVILGGVPDSPPRRAFSKRNAREFPHRTMRERRYDEGLSCLETKGKSPISGSNGG